MDKLRIALIAAFATISFMLVIEYSNFKNEHTKNQLLQNSSQPTLTADTSTPVADIDDSGVIPQLSSKPEKTGAPAKTDLISVSTDNFIIKIDPTGGDIVYVALKEHLARIDTPNIPFAILEHSNHRTYITQSGLFGQNGTDSANKRPLFSSAESSYQMAENAEQLVVDLHYQNQGSDITKRFTFKRGNYLIDVDYLIKNNSDETWKAGFYALIKRDDSVDPARENDSSMGMQPYLGFATTTEKERFKKIHFKDIEEEKFKESINGGWIAMIQHYFLSAWIGDQNQKNEYSTFRSKDGLNIARMVSPITEVAAHSEGQIHASFYVGPKDQYTLEKITENLDLSVDYGFLWMIAQPLYALLYFINNGQLHAFGKTFDIFGGLGNWGFSIIMLTILVKALFFGLNKKAYTSMAKMRAIQPKMLEIRDRYADDRQKQSQEMMSLYSKEGVNPVGGCLPMIVQMPVFISLYWVLRESVELRHAPFIGYIKDLSTMDPYFIMPLIMGVSMFFQQKLNPPPPDPMQAKVMQFLPLIFTFFFLFFPAGLVLYWVVNNILSIAQQWFITKHLIGDNK